MRSELEERGLPVGSRDVIVRDAQMSHLITDVCHKPESATFIAAEGLWADIWVNTPQTNRKMSFISAVSAVCSEAIDELRYTSPKDPYGDPSYNENAPRVFPPATAPATETSVAPEEVQPK